MYTGNSQVPTQLSLRMLTSRLASRLATNNAIALNLRVSKFSNELLKQTESLLAMHHLVDNIYQR